MLPAHRLRRSAEIGRTRTTGKSWAVGPLVLYAAPQQEDKKGPTRAAFVTGKKLGKAVVRNKIKRQLREAFRERIPYIQQGWDLLVIARPSILEADFERIRKSMGEALRRGRLLVAPDNPPSIPPAMPSAEVRDENASTVDDPALSKDS